MFGRERKAVELVFHRDRSLICISFCFDLEECPPANPEMLHLSLMPDGTVGISGMFVLPNWEFGTDMSKGLAQVGHGEFGIRPTTANCIPNPNILI